MRRHLIVTGRVQGVFFRDWCVGEARGLGLAGWVRNRRDGSVEAILDGEDAAVAAMIARAHDGPPAARVEQVRVSNIEGPAERLDGFARRPTA